MGTRVLRISALASAMLATLACGTQRVGSPLSLDQRLGQRTEADASLTPERAYPGITSPGESRAAFVAAGSESEGRYTLTTRPNGERVTTLWAGPDAPIRTNHMRIDDEGRLVLAEVEEHARGKRSRFDPPLLVLPASLEPGAEVSAESAMTVHPIDDAETVQHRGTATVTISLAGAQTVTAMGEQRRCLIVRTRFESDLDGPRVRRTTDEWYEPGVGLMARRTDEKIEFLILPVEDTTSAFIRVAD